MKKSTTSSAGSGTAAPGGKRRDYDRSGRQRDAERRRARILDAAAALFVEHGYGATSIDQIAQVAEVAAPTVYAAFGSKAALLKRVIDVAIVGDDDDVALMDRPAYADAIRDRRVDILFARFADLSAELNTRAGPLVRVLSSVAGTDDGLTALEVEFKAQVRVQAAAAIDLIPPDRRRRDLDREELVDRAAFYVSPITWGALVLDAGWSVPQYRDWLVEVFTRTLTLPEDEP